MYRLLTTLVFLSMFTSLVREKHSDKTCDSSVLTIPPNYKYQFGQRLALRFEASCAGASRTCVSLSVSCIGGSSFCGRSSSFKFFVPFWSTARSLPLVNKA